MGMGSWAFGASGEAKESEEKKEMEARLQAGKDRFNEMMANRSQNPVLGQTQAGMSGFDQFQAMQAARSNPQLMQSEGSELLSILVPDRAREISAANDVRNQQAGYDRFQAQMGANPLILQQLQQQQMGQRQMGPQFNAFGFGAQPGLAAQGGQGGSMLANMSSQGMNQLAAGQQNNPTIFKAKS